MGTVVNHLPTNIDDGGVEYVVILGRTTVGLGDIVDYKVGDRLVGQRYVSFRSVSRLGEVTNATLSRLHGSLRNKTSLWYQLEEAYSMSVTSHYEITILGLAKAEYYADEPIKEQNEVSYTTSQYFGHSQLDDYEEEYGSLPSSERIKRSRRNDE